MAGISNTRRPARWGGLALLAVLGLAACGGDDDAEGDTGGGGGGGGGGASGGVLVLGDETVSLTSARCFLDEQDAAAGGGKILFVAQGFGTNAAGEEVVVDVSRYDEDSQFAGDDVLVDIGDVTSGESVSLSFRGEIGAVTVDGSTLTADGLSFTDFDSGTQQDGSFEINC